MLVGQWDVLWGDLLRQPLRGDGLQYAYIALIVQSIDCGEREGGQWAGGRGWHGAVMGSTMAVERVALPG